MKKLLLLLITLTALLSIDFLYADGIEKGNTKVILLGTGTPNPDPKHSGPSVAIVVNDTPYIVDFGPGLIRRAAELSPEYGGKIKAMSVQNFKKAFLTHLHSDHTAGYPDLIFTSWVAGRDEPLEVYGPKGTKNMTEKLLEAYRADIDYRLHEGEPINSKGCEVVVHEIENEGVIYKDDNVKVEAFPVKHGSWQNAYGFRFTTPDKVIVISGDTIPCDNIIKYSKGADILVHEVYSKDKFDKKDEFWKQYHSKNHTSTIQLGEIASKAKPGLLVLYHILAWGSSDEELLLEIKEKYNGKVVVGSDLDIFD
ncbi:MAG: MBL fold metallo-hydrolase [Lentisphaerota bacterium]